MFRAPWKLWENYCFSLQEAQRLILEVNDVFCEKVSSNDDIVTEVFNDIHVWMTQIICNFDFNSEVSKDGKMLFVYGSYSAEKSIL